MAATFSLQCYPWIKQGHENQGNNHQLKQLFIIIQILFVSTLGKCIVNSVEIMDIS